jgi:hypothetical protein
MSEPQEGDLFAALDAVVDESSFARFVALLVDDRRAADSLPLTIDSFRGEWANQSIASFLEAARSWALDSNFGERPGPKPSNPWRVFASFLWAGRGYE